MADKNSQANDVFYVYALVKTPGEFSLADVFYIGKGKGLRGEQHFVEVQKEFNGSLKHLEIQRILGDSPSLETIKRHAYVLVGNLSETAAFDVESALIKMFGGALGSQLFNIQSGHGNQEVPQVVPLEDALIYFDASGRTIEKVPSVDLRDFPASSARPLTIVVKGTELAIEEADYRRTGQAGPIAHSELVEFTSGMRNLRGWNPSAPWSAEEARNRASVWWEISQENVLLLQKLAEKRQLQLALVVRDPRRGSSVVRYVWNVDANGTWLRTQNQWGIPLGDEIRDHSWRGHKLIKSSDNRQVLHGHSKGIAYAADCLNILPEGVDPQEVPAPIGQDEAKSSIIAACPHCAGERATHLAPRNYLCPDCQGRATDVLGWTVRLFNEVKTAGDVTTPAGNEARHADGSPCIEVAERSIAYVDGIAFRVVEGRSGGVFLTPLLSTEPPAAEVDPGTDDLERLWLLKSVELADEIQWLKEGDFLSVDYDTGDPDYTLYGQLAPEESIFHCEVVSNQFMPADDWPLDADYLQQEGWLPPDEDTPNWFRLHTGTESAASGLLLAMRHGRGCEDPRRIMWSPATFPGQLDDD